MAVGQGAFSAGDVARLAALEDRLERSEAARGAAHAAQLQDVLQLHALHTAAGLGLSTPSQVALLLHCSENRAGRLLADALGLGELPGSFDVLSSGLLSVEQSCVVVAQLAPLSPPERLAVWQRLLARLQSDREQGAVLPAPRLADLLKRWVVEADAQAAVQRRREAQERARVGYRKRDDGLVDLFLEGISGPLAQACLLRTRALAAPIGADDERSADRRRLDAAVDLLLGRVGLPLRGDDSGRSHCSSGCGCRVGAPVPCGAQVVVHVPLGRGRRHDGRGGRGRRAGADRGRPAAAAPAVGTGAPGGVRRRGRRPGRGRGRCPTGRARRSGGRAAGVVRARRQSTRRDLPALA